MKNRKNYVMRKSNPTLTQSGLLAVLLKRQRHDSDRVGLASRTPHAGANSLLDYPHSAAAIDTEAVGSTKPAPISQ
jgi:hypothetical protein